jgi:hypothetical protein
MQFWSGTPFMKTTEIVAVARMFDDAAVHEEFRPPDLSP